MGLPASVAAERLDAYTEQLALGASASLTAPSTPSKVAPPRPRLLRRPLVALGFEFA